MYKYLKSEPYFILRVVLFSPLLFFINFPFEYNADYVNYYPDYINANFSYEPLYEWYSYIVREYLGMTFFQFWLSLSVIELILFSLIYRNWLVILLSYPSIIGMSQFFYGTQVRYAIAALILLYVAIYISRRYLKAFLFLFFSFIHYGGFILFGISILASAVRDELLIVNKIKSFIMTFIFVSAIFIVQKYLDLIIAYTRFHYYIDSGKYMEPISTSSFIYICVSLLLLVLVYSSNRSLRSYEIKLAIIVLLFSFSTASIAGLSGRISLFYFILEPLVLSRVLLARSSLYLGLCLLAIYMSRNIFYITSANFFFY